MFADVGGRTAFDSSNGAPGSDRDVSQNGRMSTAVPKESSERSLTAAYTKGTTVHMAAGSRDEAFETARKLYVGIAISPFALAAVTWLLDPGAGTGGTPGVVAWTSWIVIAGNGFLLWYVFRRKAVEPVTEWSRSRRAEEGYDADTLQKHLVLAWAGAEAVGFAGPVVYFLGGNLAMLVSSLAVAALCFARSAPREEWFRTTERDAGVAQAG